MRSFRSKPIGWKNDNMRHYLAAKYGSAGGRRYLKDKPVIPIDVVLKDVKQDKNINRVLNMSDEELRYADDEASGMNWLMKQQKEAEERGEPLDYDPRAEQGIEYEPSEVDDKYDFLNMERNRSSFKDVDDVRRGVTESIAGRNAEKLRRSIVEEVYGGTKDRDVIRAWMYNEGPKSVGLRIEDWIDARGNIRSNPVRRYP